MFRSDPGFAADRLEEIKLRVSKDGKYVTFDTEATYSTKEGAKAFDDVIAVLRKVAEDEPESRKSVSQF